MESQTQVRELPSRPKQKLLEVGESHPIIMAVDPLERNVDRDFELIKAINLWTAHNPARVLPVGVVTFHEVTYPAEIILSSADSLMELINSSLEPAIKKLPENSALPPKLLLQSASSRREKVSALLEEARKVSASLIAVNTSGRTGLKFFRLGSFTEDLIAMSPCPVLTTNKNTKTSSGVRRIILPTDLTLQCKAALKHVIGYAKKFEAKLILYHEFEYPLFLSASPSQDVFLVPSLLQETWRKLEILKRQEAEKWRAEIQKQSIECEIDFSTDDKSVAEGINRVVSKHNGDLIVVFNNRPVLSNSSGLLRQIVLHSKRPVLVFRDDSSLLV